MSSAGKDPKSDWFSDPADNISYAALVWLRYKYFPHFFSTPDSDYSITRTTHGHPNYLPPKLSQETNSVD